MDFRETFAPVVRLEAIRILLAYASHHDMKLYQMDVKNTFLNNFINELVYVDQPPGYPNHVYRLSKALYGLKQSPRAWYERLWDFLIEKGVTPKIFHSFKISKFDLIMLISVHSIIGN